MNKFSNSCLVFLFGSMAFGLASCSNDDDNTDQIPAGNETLQQVVTNYVNDVVFETYKDLAVHANDLSDACTKLYTNASNGQLQQADIDAACEAFKESRKYWEQSEAFLYGAAEDKDIDPHIDSWPLSKKELADVLNDPDMVSKLKGADAAKYVRKVQGNELGSALGFHGIEFVLFRDGKNRTVDALSNNETDALMTHVKGIDELAFAAAVAADLRDKTFQLEYCWLGDKANADHIAHLKSSACDDITADQYVSAKGVHYGEWSLASGSANGWFATWEANASNIFIGGCVNIANEVFSQKLGQAYRVATGVGGSEDAADYIESPYSKRSFQDYQDNIYSIKNSLYGTRDITATSPLQVSLLSYLRDNKYEGAETLSNALNAAIKALEDAKNSGIAFVDDPGNAQVETCIKAVSALNDELNKAGKWIAAN